MCEVRKASYRSASLPAPECKRTRRNSRPFSCESVMNRPTGSPPSLRGTRISTPASTLTTSRYNSTPSPTDSRGDCATQTSCTSLPDDEDMNKVHARLSMQRYASDDENSDLSARWSTCQRKTATNEDAKALIRRRLQRKRLTASSPSRRTRHSKVHLPITAADDTEYYPSSTDLETEGDFGHPSSDEDRPPRKRGKSRAKPGRFESPSNKSVRTESMDLDWAPDTASPAALHRKPCGTGTAADAAFDEWVLQDVVPKRTFLDGRATFQLQFDWDMCCKHGDASRKRKEPSRQRRGFATVAEPSARRIFTPDEDHWLVRLKERQLLPWSEIHRRFCDKFAERSRESLQVRYCTKLKRRGDRI